MSFALKGKYDYRKYADGKRMRETGSGARTEEKSRIKISPELYVYEK